MKNCQTLFPSGCIIFLAMYKDSNFLTSLPILVIVCFLFLCIDLIFREIGSFIYNFWLLIELLVFPMYAIISSNNNFYSSFPILRHFISFVVVVVVLWYYGSNPGSPTCKASALPCSYIPSPHYLILLIGWTMICNTLGIKMLTVDNLVQFVTSVENIWHITIKYYLKCSLFLDTHYHFNELSNASEKYYIHICIDV